MRRALTPWIVAVVIVVLAAGCAMFQGSIDTPEKRYILAEALYSSQFDRYLTDIAKPGLTEAEKDILRAKREVLIKADKALDAYELYIDLGQAPPADVAKALESIIDELTRMAMEKAVK